MGTALMLMDHNNTPDSPLAVVGENVQSEHPTLIADKVTKPGLNENNENDWGGDKGVYQVLAQHQVTETWDMRELLTELHRWAAIFNATFSLNVPAYALCIDWLSRRRLGHFRPGHNAFGLEGEIAINRRHLAGREFWQVLGTLLHELLHAWQEVHGKPGKNNYHNKQFRDKAQSYGLIIDEVGHTQYEPKSAFFELLENYGVQIPAVPGPAVAVKREKSKLKLWWCGCTRVRVAVNHFHAVCLNSDCGGKFVCQE